MTNFAILLDGGSANGKGRTYMLGSFSKDIQLILPLALGFVLILIVAALLLMYTRWGRFILYGSRAELKRASRRRRSGITTVSPETDMAL